jgi:hypothetical protein
VSERPKERASKAREGQPSAGSNPAATASLTRPNAGTAASLTPAFLAVVSNVSQLVSIGASLLDHRRAVIGARSSMAWKRHRTSQEPLTKATVVRRLVNSPILQLLETHLHHAVLD